MSVSVTLQKSTAGNLDAVSSITQHIVLIIGLLFLLGFVGVAFNESEIAGLVKVEAPKKRGPYKNRDQSSEISN